MMQFQVRDHNGCRWKLITLWIYAALGNDRDWGNLGVIGDLARGDRGDAGFPFLCQERARGHLTQRLFGQSLGRIERLAWHPT